MSDGRLPTELWVKAHLRRLSAAGMPAVVRYRGEATGGMVMVRIDTLGSGVRVLSQTRDAEGKLAWIAAQADARLSAEDADAYTERARQRDPDLWVIDVEDRSGANPFEGRVMV